MSQEVRVMKLKEQGAELQRTDKLPAAAADRLTQLNERWTNTNQRLSTLQSIRRSQIKVACICEMSV